MALISAVVHVLPNGGVAEIRGHGEVGDEADESREGPEVMENAFTVEGDDGDGCALRTVVQAGVILAAVLGVGGTSLALVAHQSPGEPCEESNPEDCGDGPEPVRTVGSQVAVGIWAVDIEGVVAALEDRGRHPEVWRLQMSGVGDLEVEKDVVVV